MARKYSIKTGTLRVFAPFYIDAKTKKDFFKNTTQPRIIFFLSDGPGDVASFQRIVKEHPEPLSIYVLCENASRIKEVVSEAIALESIQSERAEIKSDPVAQRESKIDYKRLSTSKLNY